MIKCGSINVLCPHAMSMILQSNEGESNKFTICDIGINNCIFNKMNYIYMEKYVARMIQEHTQLVIRIEKLHNCIYNEFGRPKPLIDNKDMCDVVDYANMCIQLRAMKMYRDALEARLENAGIWYDGEAYREKVATIKEVLDNPIPINDKPTDEE